MRQATVLTGSGDPRISAGFRGRRPFGPRLIRSSYPHAIPGQLRFGHRGSGRDLSEFLWLVPGARVALELPVTYECIRDTGALSGAEVRLHLQAETAEAQRQVALTPHDVDATTWRSLVARWPSLPSGCFGPGAPCVLVPTDEVPLVLHGGPAVWTSSNAALSVRDRVSVETEPIALASLTARARQLTRGSRDVGLGDCESTVASRPSVAIDVSGRWSGSDIPLSLPLSGDAQRRASACAGLRTVGATRREAGGPNRFDGLIWPLQFSEREVPVIGRRAIDVLASDADMSACLADIIGGVLMNVRAPTGRPRLLGTASLRWPD